jgi:hypothetical protein
MVGSRQTLGDHDKPITFAELATQSLILPREGRGIRRRLEKVAESRGVTLEIAYQVESEPLVRRLVQAGAGLVVRPYKSVSRQGVVDAQFAVRKIVEPELLSTFYLVHSDKRPLTVAGDALRRLIGSLAHEEMQGASETQAMAAECESHSSGSAPSPIRSRTAWPKRPVSCSLPGQIRARRGAAPSKLRGAYRPSHR